MFSASSCSSTINQPPRAEVLEGTDVNLTCDHPTLSTSDYIHWYKILASQQPEFLVSGYSHIAENGPNKMIFAEDRKSNNLVMQNVRLEQSTLYICASMDTMLQANLNPVLKTMDAQAEV
uniref:Ig-like domain-containing protein n=1 Tax=Leptobrachium leishanense TaxID=445787 RepID=A0A8C5M8V3_9ANUR